MPFSKRRQCEKGFVFSKENLDGEADLHSRFKEDLGTVHLT